MAANVFVEWRSYGGKRVAIVTDHEVAIVPWTTYREEVKKPPILVTLDHHTDTRDAFGRNSYLANPDRPEEAAVRWLQQLQSMSIDAAKESAKHLYCDEQIRAGIDCEILNGAIVLCYSDTSGGTRSIEYRLWQQAGVSRANLAPPPHRYEVPAGRIFLVSNIYAIECADKSDPSSEEKRRYADQAIETVRLRDRLRQARDMARSLHPEGLVPGSYILDIDLDYFQTTEALNPADPSAFYEVLRDAALITIALEPSYAFSILLDKRRDIPATLERFEFHLIQALGKRDDC